MHKLSNRLQKIVDLVPPVTCLADIGTDHAFVPIYLIQKKMIQHAVACDVAVGPLSIARTNIQAAQLDTQIATRLADGLLGLRPADQVDLAVIAGMGGQLITHILKAGSQQLQSISQLILEPNNDEPLVRQWLNDSGCWQIVAEAIVQDGRHNYEIIRAQKQEAVAALTPQEIMFGPFLLQEKSPVFRHKWQQQLTRTQLTLANLIRAQHLEPTKIAVAQQKLQKIEEII